jgi:hypothetical protein
MSNPHTFIRGGGDTSSLKQSNDVPMTEKVPNGHKINETPF